MKDPLPSINGKRSNETTTSGAQILAPSVAKPECGGGHSLTDKVLP